MIHAETFAPLSRQVYAMAPELTEPWCSLCLTWWWFGPPYSSGVDPDVLGRDVRWKQPEWRDSDYENNQRGSRSTMFIAGGRIGQSGLGPDDRDFARNGIPADAPDEEADAWGL